MTTFTSVENLTGGPGIDRFVFANGVGVTGTVNGGGGGDFLDYAAYTTGVTVNLGTAYYEDKFMGPEGIIVDVGHWVGAAPVDK